MLHRISTRSRAFHSVLVLILVLAGCDGPGFPDASLVVIGNEADPPAPWLWNGAIVLEPFSGPAPDSALRADYERAAVILAQELVEPVRDLAALDPEALDHQPARSILNALLSVYARDGLAARDTVVEHCGIANVSGGAPTDALALRLGAASTWADAWRSGGGDTGQQAVDSLVTKYGLDWSRYLSGPDGEYVLFDATRPLNLYGLGRLFEGVAGITESAPQDARVVRGQDLEAIHLGEGGFTIRYGVGWGDCPSGCLSWRWYAFRVAPDTRVAYLGASGPPLPDPTEYGTTCVLGEG